MLGTIPLILVTGVFLAFRISELHDKLAPRTQKGASRGR